jgi:hypothetical protein
MVQLEKYSANTLRGLPVLLIVVVSQERKKILYYSLLIASPTEREAISFCSTRRVH